MTELARYQSKQSDLKKELSTLTTIAAMALSAGTAGAVGPVQVREVLHTDRTGVWVETQRIASGAGGSDADVWPAFMSLWQYDASIAIPESVAINQADAFAYEDLNNERMQAFESRGDGVPVYEHFLASTPQGSLTLADHADTAALLTTEDNGAVIVQAYTSASDTALWTYTFPDNIDGDGDSDADDFFGYLDLFASGHACADIDGDRDADDFFGYLDLFIVPC